MGVGRSSSRSFLILWKYLFQHFADNAVWETENLLYTKMFGAVLYEKLLRVALLHKFFAKYIKILLKIYLSTIVEAHIQRTRKVILISIH